MSAQDTEGFLGRWARLKQQSRDRETEPPGSDASRDRAVADEAVAEPAAAAVRTPTDEVSQSSRPLTREDFADVDFDALDFNSDYRRFMGARVPDDIRNEALRKLWASDPVLTMHDGLDDYCGDYTDAATVPAGIVKTAYRVGKGFLSDAEAAEWEALGKPPADGASEEARQVASAELGTTAAATSEPPPPASAAAPSEASGEEAPASAEASSPTELATGTPKAGARG